MNGHSGRSHVVRRHHTRTATNGYDEFSGMSASDFVESIQRHGQSINYTLDALDYLANGAPDAFVEEVFSVADDRHVSLGPRRRA